MPVVFVLIWVQIVTSLVYFAWLDAANIGSLAFDSVSVLLQTCSGRTTIHKMPFLCVVPEIRPNNSKLFYVTPVRPRVFWTGACFDGWPQGLASTAQIAETLRLNPFHLFTR